MAVSKEHDSKSPSQSPTGFYKLEKQGGAFGKPTRVPQELASGPMVEKIMGRPALHNQSKNKQRGQ